MSKLGIYISKFGGFSRICIHFGTFVGLFLLNGPAGKPALDLPLQPMADQCILAGGVPAVKIQQERSTLLAWIEESVIFFS